MTVDYREAADTTGLLPRSTWREWKALFTSGAQLYVPIDSATAEEGEKVEETDPRDEVSLRFDDIRQSGAACLQGLFR